MASCTSLEWTPFVLIHKDLSDIQHDPGTVLELWGWGDKKEASTY